MHTTSPEQRRRQLAVITLLAALGVGSLGSLLFYDSSWAGPGLVGINFPLLTGALVLGGLLAAALLRVPLRWRVLWLLGPLAFFACMVAVRAEPLMTGLNVLAVLALGGLIVHYWPLRAAPDQATTVDQISGVLAASLNALLGAMIEAVWAAHWLKHIGWRSNTNTLAVLRGLALAVPVLLVFAALLASADTIFADALSGLLGGIQQVDVLIARLLLVVCFAWVAWGVLAYGLRQPSERATTPAATPAVSPAEADPEEQPALAALPEKPKSPSGFTLGMIESSIILGSVVVLFAVFVLIQATYLFGGQANVRPGLTYADYARRGFFELVAVAVLVIGLGRWLHYATRRQGASERALFRLLTGGLVGLTLVMLASAWHRMSLYEAAYGLTHLRLYTHVFMIALAALLAVFWLEVLTQRRTLFAFGVLLVTIGYLAALNLLNVEQTIAAHNSARYEQGLELDICYLKTFSPDALPALLELLAKAEAKGDDRVADHTRQWLAQQRRVLHSENAAAYAPYTWNLGRQQALAALAAVPVRDLAAWANIVTDDYCYRSAWLD